MEQVLTLAREKRWDDICVLAASYPLPDAPESFPLVLGMILFHKRSNPTTNTYGQAIDWLELGYRCCPGPSELEMLQLMDAAIRGQGGDPIAAIRVLSSEPIRSSTRYRWHVQQNLAMCYRQIQDWSRSLAHFNSALELAEKNPQWLWQTRLDRAMTCLHAGLVDDAMSTWEAGLPPEPYTALYHLLGLEVHLANGSYPEAVRQGAMALALFRRIRHLDSGMPLAEYQNRGHLALARALLAQGHVEQAIYHCKMVAGRSIMHVLPGLVFDNIKASHSEAI